MFKIGDMVDGKAKEWYPKVVITDVLNDDSKYKYVCETSNGELIKVTKVRKCFEIGDKVDGLWHTWSPNLTIKDISKDNITMPYACEGDDDTLLFCTDVRKPNYIIKVGDVVNAKVKGEWYKKVTLTNIRQELTKPYIFEYEGNQLRSKKVKLVSKKSVDEIEDTNTESSFKVGDIVNGVQDGKEYDRLKINKIENSLYYCSRGVIERVFNEVTPFVNKFHIGDIVDAIVEGVLYLNCEIIGFDETDCELYYNIETNRGETWWASDICEYTSSDEYQHKPVKMFKYDCDIDINDTSLPLWLRFEIDRGNVYCENSNWIIITDEGQRTLDDSDYIVFNDSHLSVVDETDVERYYE